MRLKYSAARLAGEFFVRTLILILSPHTAEGLTVSLERSVFLSPFLKQPRIVPKLQQCGSNLLRSRDTWERGIKARFLVPPFGIAGFFNPPDEFIPNLESSRADIQEIAVAFLRGTREGDHTVQIQTRRPAAFYDYLGTGQTPKAKTPPGKIVIFPTWSCDRASRGSRQCRENKPPHHEGKQRNYSQDCALHTAPP